jgi:hypothetical protein
MWQKQDDGTTRTWADALPYCGGLPLGGYSDWRLPNIKELSSIVDDTVFNPAINAKYFPATRSSWYWSSTTFSNVTTRAWAVYFVDGNINYNSKTGSFAVRCVRLGQ